MLVTDKEDSSMYKLLKFNVSNGDERLITEKPYRKDCGIAFLKGKVLKRIFCPFLSNFLRSFGVLTFGRL